MPTFRDLKNQLNTLTEEQLDQEVFLFDTMENNDQPLSVAENDNLIHVVNCTEPFWNDYKCMHLQDKLCFVY